MVHIASRNVLLKSSISIRATVSIFSLSLRFSYIGSKTSCTNAVPCLDNPDSSAAIVRKLPDIPAVRVKDTTSYGNPLNSVGGLVNLYYLTWSIYSSTFMDISIEGPFSASFVVLGVCPNSCSDGVPMLFVSIEVQVNSFNADWVWCGCNRS